MVAIIGAGVSGLTCGVVFAERGYRTASFAEETGQQTTSGAAAALWFPYDAEPAEKVIPWALQTFDVLVDLTHVPASGVSIIELRQFSRTREIQVPDWAIPLGARPVIASEVEGSRGSFKSGFTLRVPLDCVFGGTNDLSSDLAVDAAATDQIIAECSRVLNIDKPNILAERVGLRPFRKSGVRLERNELRDGRTVIHNYGHGGSGFTLSWGCAREVVNLARL